MSLMASIPQTSLSAVRTNPAGRSVTSSAGFVRTAESDVCGIEAMSDTDRDLYGVQWHPEVAHTEEGEAVFENFLEICADGA